MANWALHEETITGLPVAKRARHGIHFARPDGLIQADFSGKPCHFLDGGEWKPIDTKPSLLPDGSYGCPHSPLRIYSDGVVSILGTDYAQRARLFSAGNVKLDGDRLVRSFNGGEQSLYITEDGFRSEIRLDRKPNLLQAAYLLASVSGKLPGHYIQHPTVMTDADGREYTYDTAANLRAWLEGAKYPVVIDPDFTAGTGDKFIQGVNATYLTARATSTGENNSSNECSVGNALAAGSYYIFRGYLLFDTSSITSAATVNQCNLKMTLVRDETETDFDVQIVKQDWSSGTREEQYDGCLAGTADDNILANTSGWTLNTQKTSGNLSTTWVSKIGTTYYSLRNANDYAGNQPSGRQESYLGSANHATAGYRPVLTVLYSVPSTAFVPILDNSNSIILNGSIVR